MTTRIIASLSLGIAFGLAFLYPLYAAGLAMLALGLYSIGGDQ